jgi:DNA-binding transcriptional ArsR family regulator
MILLVMGISKTTQFTQLQNRKAELFKALGHPARIAIIEYLLDKSACICNDLVEILPLSQSTISQHLAALKKVGIIKGEIEGAKMCYCIDITVWEELDTINQLLIRSYSKKNECC